MIVANRDRSEAQQVTKLCWSQFWSAHQRFFRYLCISAKVEHAIMLAKDALRNDKVTPYFPAIPLPPISPLFHYPLFPHHSITPYCPAIPLPPIAPPFFFPHQNYIMSFLRLYVHYVRIQQNSTSKSVSM